MYRRRRTKRTEIAFSFDSFLDVVANVCGIIIRLILVAWAGGRSYHALMQWPAPTSAPAPEAGLSAPRPEDDPASAQIRQSQRELEEARARLTAQLQDLGLKEQGPKRLDAQLTSLRQDRQQLEQQRQKLDSAGGSILSANAAALTMDEINRRQQTLLEEISKLETAPAPTKELRFRTPVSRRVQADEVFFECRGGRVAFIDLPAFMQEVQGKLESQVDRLRTSWKVEDVTRAVGPFRLRYLVEREPDALDTFGTKPRSDGNFRYGVTAWEVEPVTPLRGETVEAALAANSEFRQLVDTLDSTTVVTLWVYPDSFALFRQVRDYAYERGLEVAGRPLPEGGPIAGSRHGSASRGQ